MGCDYSPPVDPRKYTVVPEKEALLFALGSPRVLVRFDRNLAVEITQVHRCGVHTFEIAGKTMDGRAVFGEVFYGHSDSWAMLDVEELAEAIV